jgi:SpoVK/Ycf46/Vps4 family AAA+-type ATPase
MDSKSNAKKAPAEKSKDKNIGNCGWCDKYGKMKCSINHVETSYGAVVSSDDYARKRFCNDNCQKAYILQENTIDIKHNIADYKRLLEERTKLYKEEIETMKNPTDKVDIQKIKKTGEALFAMIKYFKTAKDFYESLLHREKKDILTVKRYKCLKLVGDVYEAIQGNDYFHSSIHNFALNEIYGFNDHIDEYGKEQIIGAKAQIEVFGK